MSTLKMHDTAIFERIFDRGGYVLDFTNASFTEFFNEFNIDIDAQKYCMKGSSKMKRLRSFWQIEPNQVVGEVLDGLLKYASAIENINPQDHEKALTIINKLLGKEQNQGAIPSTEEAFVKESFSKIDSAISHLKLDSQFEQVIKQRIDEIKNTLKVNASLATIFLCGSTLEGLLLETASKNIVLFNQAISSPRDNSGKVRNLHDWTLDQLINTSRELNLISEDVKKFSHALRGFRNYIHPRVQIMQNFYPDQHTAKISWQVLQAAISDLGNQR